MILKDKTPSKSPCTSPTSGTTSPRTGWKSAAIQQVEVLQQLITMVYEDYNKIEVEEDEAYLKKLTDAMLASKDDLEKLLAQTERPTSKEDLTALTSMPSLAVYTAWSMEMIYNPQHVQILQQINSVLGTEKMSEFIMKRAKQLLTDPDTAEFPDPSRVDEARGKANRDDLGKLTYIEIRAY